jgi:hypothetical protein
MAKAPPKATKHIMEDKMAPRQQPKGTYPSPGGGRACQPKDLSRSAEPQLGTAGDSPSPVYGQGRRRTGLRTRASQVTGANHARHRMSWSPFAEAWVAVWPAIVISNGACWTPSRTCRQVGSLKSSVSERPQEGLLSRRLGGNWTHGYEKLRSDASWVRKVAERVW